MITRRIATGARTGVSSYSSALWTCPACTRASSLPPSHRGAARQPQQQRRGVHHVPPLRYDESFRQDGVPGLFSPAGFRIAWTGYQTMMVQKLNELTAGEAHESVEPKKLALQFARDPRNASLFNHASMAHNNHFFFSTLSTAPQRLDARARLSDSLLRSFGSIDTLRATMLDTAAAMFGPGFVWLVWSRDSPSPDGGGGGRPASSVTQRGDWRILTTYLAGTPYPEAGYRQQGLDMNTADAATAAAAAAASSSSAFPAPFSPANSVGAFGAHSQSERERAKLPPGGTRVMPVLCVNTWEHVYIYDFGLAGKRKYLSDWWDAVDWSVVDANSPPDVRLPTTGVYQRR